jgi:hypothetical protein
VLRPEFKGKKNVIVGAQHDLVSTLLNQLHQQADEFKWSKNLTNPNVHQFAYYALTTGFGWITPTHALAYNYQNKSNDWNNCEQQTCTDSLNYKGKAYLQKLFQEYLDY